MEARVEEVGADVCAQRDEADRAPVGALAHQHAPRVALPLDRLGDEILAKRAAHDVRLRLEDGHEVVVVLDAARPHVERREDGLPREEEQLRDRTRKGGARWQGHGGEERSKRRRQREGCPVRATGEHQVVDLGQRLKRAPEEGLDANKLRVRIKSSRCKEDDAAAVAILQAASGRRRRRGSRKLVRKSTAMFLSGSTLPARRFQHPRARPCTHR